MHYCYDDFIQTILEKILAFFMITNRANKYTYWELFTLKLEMRPSFTCLASETAATYQANTYATILVVFSTTEIEIRTITYVENY